MMMLRLLKKNYLFIYFIIGCAGSSLLHRGFLWLWIVGAILFWSMGSRVQASVVVVQRPSCPTACGILPDKESNLCPLHWQVDSQSLGHQGSPRTSIFSSYFVSVPSSEYETQYWAHWNGLKSACWLDIVICRLENSSQIIYGFSPDKVLIYALFGKFPSSKSPIFHRHMLETQRCYSLTLTFEEESYIQMLNWNQALCTCKFRGDLENWRF